MKEVNLEAYNGFVKAKNGEWFNFKYILSFFVRSFDEDGFSIYITVINSSTIHRNYRTDICIESGIKKEAEAQAMIKWAVGHA